MRHEPPLRDDVPVMRTIRSSAIAFGSLALVQPARPQEIQGFISSASEPISFAEGWVGFTDIGFLAGALVTLLLAAVLGAAIGYHPKHLRAADTLQEVEAPKVYILCSLIGALIGILVVNYGLVVGFVIFGIGGLIRFRTVLRSPEVTGNVIFVTLIGLSTGLHLPHVAVLATAFGFVLIYILDSRQTFQVDVRGLPPERVADAAMAYRGLLEQHGSVIVNEKKNPERGRIRLIFRPGRNVTQEQLESAFESNIDPSMRGSLDWEVD